MVVQLQQHGVVHGVGQGEAEDTGGHMGGRWAAGLI